MKKISILCLAGLMGLGLASCNEDYPFADPQSNPQEAILQTSDITVTQLAQTVTISDYLNASGSDSLLIPVASAEVKKDAMPANTYLQGYIDVASKEDFSDAITLKGLNAAESDTLWLSPSELEDKYFNDITRSPKTKNVYVRAHYETVTNATSTATVGEPNYFGLNQVALTPLPKLHIDEAYYLTGDMAGWNKEGAIQFTHSGEDVYADPVFTVDFTTTADNQYWKIIPKTNYDGDFWANPGVVGVVTDGDASLNGKLITDGAAAGKIELAGDYRMTINMEEMTYNIQRLSKVFFVVGTPNGWNADTKSNAFFPIENDNVQSYTGHFTGAYDMKIWMTTEFGNWSKCYGTQNDGDNSASGKLINSNAQSFASPEAGFYTLTVDFKNLTYSWTKLSNQAPAEYAKVTISGDFNGWGDTEMKQSGSDKHNWYLLDVKIDNAQYGCKFKTFATASSDPNWLGGTDKWPFGVANGGGNIPDKVGTYDIYFNDITNQYFFVEKES